MPDIQFFLDNVDFSLRNTEVLTDWLIQLARNEGKNIDEVNVILVSDDRLLEINREFLKHDYYTDIITFQNEGKELSGEIYISVDRVKENSKTNDIVADEEFHRVLAHGFLHMLGYKDKSDEEKMIMRSKEDFYLNLRPI